MKKTPIMERYWTPSTLSKGETTTAYSSSSGKSDKTAHGRVDSIYIQEQAGRACLQRAYLGYLRALLWWPCFMCKSARPAGH